MHQATLAVEKLAEELAETQRQLADAQKTAEYAKRDAIDALKSEMLNALTESDIKREVAVAKLDAYEEANDKDDFNREIREMLKQAIAGLSAIKPGGQQGGGQKPQQEQKKD